MACSESFSPSQVSGHSRLLVTQVTEKSKVDIPGSLQHDRAMIDARLHGLPVANCIGLQLLPLELLLADRDCG
jgi:hypothetical protein